MDSLNLVECTKYTGFSPSYKHTLATKNVNVIHEAPEKNYYGQISDNKRLKIPYFQKDTRWMSNYDSGHVDHKYLFSPENKNRKKICDLGKIYFFEFLYF